MDYSNTNDLVERLRKYFQSNNNFYEGRYTSDNKGLEYKKAAVLVPFVFQNSEWSILFTRRSDSLRNHKGQVSFPGGAMDPNDCSSINAALRETYEEIGIQKKYINVLGELPEMITNTNFIVTPVIAVLQWPLKLSISEDEVSRVFTIPFAWLANPLNWEERVYNHPSGWYGSVIFYEKYDGELLWGISAAIMQRVIQILDGDIK